MNFTKRLSAIFLLIIVNTTCPAEETIRLTNGEWTPWLSKELKYYGLASRIVTEAFALEGVKVEYRFFPWKRSYEAAKKGEWDGSVIWSRQSDREKAFYFSETVLNGKLVFFHLKNNKFDWKDIEDLKRVKIGAVIGYTYGENFDNAVKTGKISIQYVPKDVQNFAKLLAGRIQIFPVELDVGYEMINNNFKPDEAKLFTHHPKPIRVTSFHLILSRKVKRNKRMLILFNKGLKRLYESGKVDQYIAEAMRGEYRIK